MKVGSIFKLKNPCLDNLVGTLGVCFAESIEGEEGAQVIFANGEYGGFLPEEEKKFLEYIGKSQEVESYQFISVKKLYEDFRAGIFNTSLNRE